MYNIRTVQYTLIHQSCSMFYVLCTLICHSRGEITSKISPYKLLLTSVAINEKIKCF